MKTLELKKNFYWAGSLDPELRVFDIIMNTEFGTTYNSYFLKGSEKTALFESSKTTHTNEYLEQLSTLVDLKDIDYIIVSHTEPDHSGTIAGIIEKNPAVKLVGTATAMRFMKEITNMDFTSVIVKDGDSLSLGDKTLRFFTAPNLHWPDAMFTYIEEDKTLITCDAFGCHYSFDGIVMSKLEDQEGYDRALRYYFDNIMGPFKPFVLKAINKIKDLDIDMICPGHGPVLDEDPWKIVNVYKEWSSDENPNKKKTVVIPYVSAYGYTEELGKKIAEGIKAAADIDVRMYDMVTAKKEEVLDEMFWADGLLFGTPTIVGEALKPIWDLTTSIFPVTHCNKIASAFGSYGWSGEGVPHIMERLKQLRLKVYGDGYRIPFKPSAAQLEGAFEFGYGFGLSVDKGEITMPEDVDFGSKNWKCLVCGEIVEGLTAPEVCPVCGVGPEQFVAIAKDDISFSSETKERFLVLGGGIAGLTAAEEIRKRNKVATIEIITEEDVPCYNRPMLTKGILSEPEGITFFTKQEEWYKENNIKVTTGAKVEKLELAGKTVTLESGEKKEYDKLIYALGAESNRIPIKGSDREGVFYIRKLADVDAVRSNLDKIKTVAVIGGGVLGLEAAWEFARAGKDVTVIEISSGIMKNQLDEKGSEVLRKAAEKAGVKVECGTGIQEVTADSVILQDGRKIPAEMVSISAGIKPNSAIGIEAGLVGDRWIEANAKMQTGDADVFVAGDVAVVNGVSVAIWNQALEMGRVAGINAAGDEAEYTPVVPSNAFSGFGVDLFAIGDNGKKEDLHYKAVEVYEEVKGIYKKMYFVNDKFAGGILIGAQELAPKMLEAYEKRLSFKEAMSIL